MKKKQRRYFVRWIETHEVEVKAPSEKSAFRAALRIPPKKTLDSADQPIIIAA